MHASIGSPLQRLPELSCEDLDISRRSLALMRDLTVAPETRARLDDMGQRDRRNAWLRTAGRRGIEITVQEVELLLRAGVSRAAVTMIPVLIMEIIDELCDADTGGDRLSLELENMRLDAEEDALQGPALVEAETPEAMLARAHLLRKEASAKLALARHLEGIVRRRTLALMRRAS